MALTGPDGRHRPTPDPARPQARSGRWTYGSRESCSASDVGKGHILRKLTLVAALVAALLISGMATAKSPHRRHARAVSPTMSSASSGTPTVSATRAKGAGDERRRPKKCRRKPRRRCHKKPAPTPPIEGGATTTAMQAPTG